MTKNGHMLIDFFSNPCLSLFQRYRLLILRERIQAAVEVPAPALAEAEHHWPARNRRRYYRYHDRHYRWRRPGRHRPTPHRPVVQGRPAHRRPSDSAPTKSSSSIWMTAILAAKSMSQRTSFNCTTFPNCATASPTVSSARTRTEPSSNAQVQYNST